MTGQLPHDELPAGRDQTGRVVIVTGAGKGLGAAFAKACAARGARVVVSNRRRPGAADDAGRVVDEIRAAGGEAIAEYSDIAEPGAADAVVRAALNAWGRLDAVIANAGTSGPADKVRTAGMAGFRDVLETNFFANVALAQAAIEPLIASGAGRFVFVSSSAGLYGVRGRAPYAASKGALNAFAQTLADELRRDGIGVNILAPYAATRMTEEQGVDERGRVVLAPERVAAAAVWLSSAACSCSGEIWVSGAGRMRQARMMEGQGARFHQDLPAADMDRLAGTLRSGEGMHGFAGAEAAFADLMTERARDAEAARPDSSAESKHS
tara:strand:- start:89879 stop:90850 length:972 start_codon:yes stop_codon:yes gene_type:complete